jgi:hypothetical protein
MLIAVSLHTDAVHLFLVVTTNITCIFILNQFVPGQSATLTDFPGLRASLLLSTQIPPLKLQISFYSLAYLATHQADTK